MCEKKRGAEFSKHIGSTFFRQGVAAFAGLMTTVVIARTFGPEGSGTFSVALLLPTTLFTFFNLGLPTSVTYHVSAGILSAGDALRRCTNTLALTIVSGLAVGLLSIQENTNLFPGVERKLLVVSLVAYPLLMANGCIAGALHGLQLFKHYNVLMLMQPISLLAMVLGISAIGIGRHEVLIGVYALSCVMAFFYGWSRIVKLNAATKIKLKCASAPNSLLGYGWKVHLSNVIAFVSYKADVYIVNLYGGVADVGVYVIALGAAEKLGLISQASSTVLLPKIAALSGNEAERNRITSLVSRLVLLATSGCAILAAVVAYFAFELVFGRRFGAAYFPFILLLPGVVLSGVARVLANDIAARGRPELNFRTSIVAASTGIIGSLILVPFYGLLGAAFATSVAYSINLFLRLVVYSRLTGCGLFLPVLLQGRDIQKLWRLLKPL